MKKYRILYEIESKMIECKLGEKIIKHIVKSKFKKINRLNIRQLWHMWNECDFLIDEADQLPIIEKQMESIATRHEIWQAIRYMY